MTRLETGRASVRWLVAAAFFIAGVAHLRTPEPFLAITPEWVPMPLQVILFTGVCEILGAIGLLIPRLRRLSGIMLALYAVCVFPANIRHAMESIAVGGTTLGWSYHFPRLAFQPVIVWMALFAGGVITWPFGRRNHRAR